MHQRFVCVCVSRMLRFVQFFNNAVFCICLCNCEGSCFWDTLLRGSSFGKFNSLFIDACCLDTVQFFSVVHILQVRYLLLSLRNITRFNSLFTTVTGMCSSSFRYAQNVTMRMRLLFSRCKCTRRSMEDMFNFKDVDGNVTVC